MEVRGLSPSSDIIGNFSGPIVSLSKHYPAVGNDLLKHYPAVGNDLLKLIT